ncbi:MAG: biotin/lipoyl-containing protein [Terriglobales bacterium]
MFYDILIDGTPHKLELSREGRAWSCRIDGEQITVDAVLARPDVLSVVIGGAAYEVKRERTPSDTHLWVKNSRFAVEVRDPRSLRSRKAAAAGAEGPQKIVAPMPGKIVRILASAGAAVEAKQGIVVVEAMKMQNEMKAVRKGTVKQVLVQEGATVNAGDVLAIVE